MQVPRDMQVPHEEVHERISWILKNYGFCPTEEGIDVGNLYLLTILLSFCGSNFLFKHSFVSTCSWSHRYEDVLSKDESPCKNGMKAFVLIKISFKFWKT